MKKLLGTIVIACAAVGFFACDLNLFDPDEGRDEDSTPKVFSLTVLVDPLHGSTDTASFEVPAGESVTVTVLPHRGFVPESWVIVHGAGLVINEIEPGIAIVTLLDGDAVIRAEFGRIQLSLLSPVGGETVLPTGDIDIVWDAQNVSGTVTIELLTPSHELVRVIATGVSAEAGVFSWASVDAVPLGEYVIRVTWDEDDSFASVSPASFFVTSVRVTGPYGAQTAYTGGSNCTISWESELPSGDLMIELISSDATVIPVASAVPIEAGSYIWTVPAAIDDGPYRIRVTLVDNPVVYSESHVPFFVLNTIDVDDPVPQTITAGAPLAISWTCVPAGSVRVELIRDGIQEGVVVESHGNDTPETVWDVPVATMPSAGYRIRVTVDTTPPVVGESSSFTIRSPAPDSISATNGNSTAHVRVSWSAAPSSPEYALDRRVSGQSQWTGIHVTPSLTYDDSSAVPGTVYEYRVTPTKNGVVGVASASASGYRMIATPSMQSASAQSTGIYVTWGSVTGATQYNIRRSVSVNTGYSTIDSVGSAVWSYTDTSAAPGQRYYYRIQAFSPTTGATPQSSNSVNAFVAFGAPGDVTATTDSITGVTVSWGGVEGAVNGYRLYRAYGGTETQIATPIATARSYLDSPPVNGRVYTYRLRAYNTITGNGPISGGVIGHTIPPPPYGVTAVRTALNTTRVSWVVDADDTHYEIWRGTLSGHFGGHISYVRVAIVSTPTSHYDDTHSQALRYGVKALYEDIPGDPSSRTSSTMVTVPIDDP